jgi:hypothetical protein
MIATLLSPCELLRWQVKHYTKRMAETTDPVAKAWLKHQLKKLSADVDTDVVAERANRNLSIQFRNHQKQLA